MIKFKYNHKGRKLHSKHYVLVVTWRHGDADCYQEQHIEFDEDEYDYYLKTINFLWSAPSDTEELFNDAVKAGFNVDEYDDVELAFIPPIDAKYEFNYAGMANVNLYVCVDETYIRMDVKCHVKRV
jgi:hypothetical protein